MVRTKFDGPKGTKPAKKKTSGVKKRSSKSRSVLKEIQNNMTEDINMSDIVPLRRESDVRSLQPIPNFQNDPVMAAFQEAAQKHIANLLEDSSMCALYSKRTTVLPKDVKLAQRIRGESE